MDINQPPKQMQALAKLMLTKMASQHRKGQSLDMQEFFGAVMMYAMTATESDLNRLIRINIAEVMREEIKQRKFDA
ncbi:hypothetical protein [Alteromonas antoniana]|uniref:hypothetical protein n=1 Tax=Alteromonas antoniana TaxID=2803813 RepID=UPI001C471AC6|nr:hypothetical protein [Alteromonas antoniana]